MIVKWLGEVIVFGSQNTAMLYWVGGLWLMTVSIGLGMYWWFKYRPLSLFSSLIVALGLASFGISVIGTALSLHLPLLIKLSKWLCVSVIVIGGICEIGLLLLLVFQAFYLWYQAKRTLQHNLLLCLGGVVGMAPLLIAVSQAWLPIKLDHTLLDFEKIIGVYISLWLTMLLFAILTYYFVQPHYDKEYVLILGAGLTNGKIVSPILAHRVQRGLTFAHRQYQLTGKYPLIVMAGGQGSDEELPEAVAMANYAIQMGISREYLLMETTSRNTFENMAFSKQLLIKNGVDLRRGIFVTSGYHVFRASIYALDNGLPINGIGAKTHRHFWFDALIREYLAILARYKYVHIIAIIGAALWATSIGYRQ